MNLKNRLDRLEEYCRQQERPEPPTFTASDEEVAEGLQKMFVMLHRPFPDLPAAELVSKFRAMWQDAESRGVDPADYVFAHLGDTPAAGPEPSPDAVDSDGDAGPLRAAIDWSDDDLETV